MRKLDCPTVLVKNQILATIKKSLPTQNACSAFIDHFSFLYDKEISLIMNSMKTIGVTDLSNFFSEDVQSEKDLREFLRGKHPTISNKNIKVESQEMIYWLSTFICCLRWWNRMLKLQAHLSTISENYRLGTVWRNCISQNFNKHDSI